MESAVPELFISSTLSEQFHVALAGEGLGLVARLIPEYSVVLHEPVTELTMTNVFDGLAPAGRLHQLLANKVVL